MSFYVNTDQPLAAPLHHKNYFETKTTCECKCVCAFPTSENREGKSAAAAQGEGRRREEREKTILLLKNWERQTLELRGGGGREMFSFTLKCHFYMYTILIFFVSKMQYKLVKNSRIKDGGKRI